MRELEGALNKVLAISLSAQSAYPFRIGTNGVKDLIAIRVQAVSMDNICKVVAEFYDISVKDLMGKSVYVISLVRVRWLSLAREPTNNSFTEIGNHFGGRDHTTVMYACESTRTLWQI